jgi:DNA-binding NtrC family response regulator
VSRRSKTRIVVVDDEIEMASLLAEVLTEEGHVVEAHTDSRSALAAIVADPPALVITDLRMGELDGLELLTEVKRKHPEIPVILITAFGSIDLAIEATRKGAYHFITKPFRLKEVVVTVDRALRQRKIERENDRLREAVSERFGVGQIIGKSRPMERVFDLIKRVAPTGSNVLILGESGTGKELVAKALHYNSPRQAEPFVAVNCSALPEGLLESELFGHVRGAFTGAHSNKKGLFQEASGGTLFLDEIGDMGLALQAKLLRAIQERMVRPVGGTKEIEVDTRLLAATNRDLKLEVREGRFREDLFYRLSVIPIRLPPLRERPEDIPLLANHFLNRLQTGGRPRSLSPNALRQLVRMPFEGNVRELENCIERAYILALSDIIEPGDLAPEDPTPSLAAGPIVDTSDLPTLQELERRYIVRVLKLTAGNKEEASRILGIDRRTLYRWRQRFGLDAEAGTEGSEQV